MGGVTSDMLRKKRKEKPLTLHFPHRPFYIKGVEIVQIIKVNTKDMIPEKAINYLITHSAALKVSGNKEMGNAVHMGLNSLQAWKKVKEEIEDERQKYIENYNDEAVEIIDAICEIIDSRFKRMAWEKKS